MAGLHLLADLDRTFADDTAGRRLDDGALQIEVGLRELGRRLLDGRVSRGGARPRDLDLLRSGLCRSQGRFGPRRGHARLNCALFSDSHRGPGGNDLGLGRLYRGTRGVGGGHGGVELLLRDLFLLDQRLEPLDVARGAACRRLPLAGAGLGRQELRLCGIDLARGDGNSGLGFIHATAGRAQVARRRNRGDWNAHARGLRVGQLRGGAVNGHLILARVDAGEHRALLAATLPPVQLRPSDIDATRSADASR